MIPSPEAKQKMQDIFNRACAGVIQQGERAAENGNCRYRLPKDGQILKCAIGHILSDDQIREHQVTDSINPWGFSYALTKELLGDMLHNDARHFLIDLQRCHDLTAGYGSVFVESFKEKANSVARQYELDPIA
jgi:hypothetical protein